ncbi:monovalent cation:proton antiporter-2 (CPA2) family protein [Hirschia litorea]|uniref:Monovalent cation:proton antiporter-2 (CPA2) family protein n=1 Tax=Hirschia litorea TaxID=1199156 RepID=A0ABW2IIT3_9PROT
MSDFLLLAFIFLCAGVVAVPIASRLGLGSVLGYLIAGIVISPLLTLLHVDVMSIQHFAEFGVVMMLFLVGLELEPKLLWKMRIRLMGLGGGQVFCTAILIMVISIAFGLGWKVSLAIGLVLALSSTAIVLQTLNEKGLMKSDGGQSAFSVLLFQDIAIIPMLAMMPLLASPEIAEAAAQAMGHAAEGNDHGSDYSLVRHLNAWQTTLVSLGAVAIVVLGGNYLTRPIFRFISAAHLRELFTAAALMLIIGISLLMNLVGLSPALGAFLAGVVLANSEYRHELESDVEPFKGILLGIFFITVGARIDFELLFSNFANVIGLTFGLILLKASVLMVLAYIFNIRGQHKWLFALGLAQAGEFGFVLLSFVVTNHIIPAYIADQLMLVVALSMLITPCLFIIYDKLIAPQFNKSQTREADTIHTKSKIIMAGRGRMGSIVDRMLRSAGYDSTVIDYSSKHLDILRAFGVDHTYFGDATRPDLLHAAGIEDAKILIVLIDQKAQINKLVKYAATHYPDLHIIARAVDRDHVYELWSLGCRDIVRETYDSSLRIGRSTLEALGHSYDIAEEIKNTFDAWDREAMRETADAYDINIPAYQNKAFLAKVRQMLEEREPELRRKISDIKAKKPASSSEDMDQTSKLKS